MEVFEKSPALPEGPVEERLAVEVEEVEGNQYHRNLVEQLAGDHLSAQPPLKLEEAEYPAVPMGQDLAVDQ